MRKSMKGYFELCRIKVSLFSAFSAVTGCLLISPYADFRLVRLAAGVLMLACGSSALNQYQERDIDTLMIRTMNRPLPSGSIFRVRALLLSLVLISAGSALLAAGRWETALLGLFTVVWYNFVYTPLKRKTAFAIIPGGIVGAAPPAIGWVYAGGLFLDPRLAVLCFFFFMWQVPHFWLFLLDHGEEYERAGLPSLTSIFDRDQIVRMSFVWISSMAVSCIFISACGVTRSLPVNISLVAVSIWLIGNGIRLLHKRVKKADCSFAFKGMNTGMVLVMIILAADRLLQL
jgi:heme o synthase